MLSSLSLIHISSGHWFHYKENMYTTVIDGEDYAIKTMNCPGGMLVYKSEPHSYRDLPLRVGELGLVPVSYTHLAAGWRLESAAVTTPQLAKARGYAQNWDEFKQAGIGLLLFGNVGTGKSYAAGCIANALIDRLDVYKRQRQQWPQRVASCPPQMR